MSFLQPFYGGTLAGQRLAGFLNRLLLLLEFGFVIWHVIAMTNGGAFYYSWFFWLIYACLVILAMKIISSVLGFLCRLFLAAKYGATAPADVARIGEERDLNRKRKAEAKRRAAEKDSSASWKQEPQADSPADPYNIEKNREVFRKL